MCKLPIIRIPLGGKNNEDKFALVDGDYDGEYFSQFRWFTTGPGYPTRTSQGKHILLHLEVLGKRPKGMWADHINRNSLDNRSCNLRWVTPQQNTWNRTQPNTLGYRGVGRNGNKFTGYCAHKYLGTFNTILDAANAYDKEASKVYGKFAQLNFPI